MTTTVLAYHAVGDCPEAEDPYRLWVPSESFEAQMDTLARSGRVVPLDALVEGPRRSGARAVAITFDDAYRSVLTNAAPVLKRLGLPATVFTPTKHIGDRNRWDPEVGRPLEIMGVDELRELERSGIAIESHGHGHIDLSTADAATAREDLEASIEVLADVVGHRPRHLAFPFSTGSGAARRAAEELGFRAAFSIDLPHEGRYAWGRVYIGPDDGVGLFRLKASGQYLRLRHNKGLDLAYHALRRIAPRR